MEQRLRLVTLGVRDLRVARAFYVDGLGWEPVLELDEVVFVPVGHGLVLSLWGAQDLAADAGIDLPPPGPGRFALAHNVDSPAEVDAFLARAVAAGGTLVKPGQAAPWGGYSGYVAAPDGFLWESAWNAGLTADPDGTIRFGG